MPNHRLDDWGTDPDGVAWGRALNDTAAMSALRQQVAALAEGLDLSRMADHEVVARLRAITAGREKNVVASLPAARWGGAAGAAARPPAPAPAPARAPGAAPRAVPAAAPPAPESTFAAELDVEAMVAALRNAAATGMPFCEECARAAARTALAA